VHEYVDGEVRARPDTVVTEEPLEIRLEWPGHAASRVSVTMRTPGHDFELATGFLLSEGVLAPGAPPHSVAYCRDRALTREQRYNVVTVVLDRLPVRHPGLRSTSVSSACGVCGAQSLDEVYTPDTDPMPLGRPLAPERVTGLPDLLRERETLFGRTGSLHAAGVFTPGGRALLVREDVGRHNAVDKVLGARQLGHVSYDESAILCVSGRVGFDIVSKAVVGRLPVVVAVGGPSSLALELAERAGMTVCGFARGGRFVTYTHPERLGLEPVRP